MRTLEKVLDFELPPAIVAKAKYWEVYNAAMKLKDKWGIEFEPCVLWWPTPASYFQKYRGLDALFFQYEGKSKRVQKLNKQVESAWYAYLRHVL